ncbi:MAG: hypothetical protein U0Q11_13880 [Vicinamibacterales bacterium]
MSNQTAYKPPTRQERFEQVHREIGEKIEAEKARRAKEVADIEQQHKDRVAAWDLRLRLQRDLDREKQITEDATTLARRRTSRDYSQRIGLELSDAERQELDLEQREASKADAKLPDVVRLREWVDRVARQHGIDVREFMDPMVANGKALRRQLRVTIPPVQSFETAATAAHELGHLLSPEAPPDATRHQLPTSRVCVAAELLAWEWSMDNAPVWNQRMRESMRRAIETYRSYATPQESAQIDALISDNRFRLARLGASERSLQAVIEERTK